MSFFDLKYPASVFPWIIGDKFSSETQSAEHRRNSRINYMKLCASRFAIIFIVMLQITLQNILFIIIFCLCFNKKHNWMVLYYTCKIHIAKNCWVYFAYYGWGKCCRLFMVTQKCFIFWFKKCFKMIKKLIIITMEIVCINNG